MSVVLSRVHPHVYITIFAVLLISLVVPIQAYFAAQVSGLHAYVRPSTRVDVPVISGASPQVLAASIAPLPPNCRMANCIALTFDDGPNPETTSKILDVLRAHKVSATFFVVGKRVHGNESILQRMQREGHEIGNHSWSHGDFSKMTPQQIHSEIDATQKAVKGAGVPAPRLFRPPYGSMSQDTKKALPLRIALWNEDPRDWEAKDAASVQAALLASARPGGVIDAHDIYHVTADALAPTIVELKARNFSFVTVSQMMAGEDLEPGQEFYGFEPPTHPQS
jgi:peptidoglycan/xylan/chitin deacetylase (PgdA/CDA1 family)